MKNTMNNVSSLSRLSAYATACEVTKCINSKDAVIECAFSLVFHEKVLTFCSNKPFSGTKSVNCLIPVATIFKPSHLRYVNIYS